MTSTSRRIVLMAALAACTALAGGCGPLAHSSAAGGDGVPDSHVRFVVLFPPSIPGPFDIHAGPAADHLTVVDRGVAAGTVTDYVAVPSVGIITVTRAGDDKPILNSASVGSGDRHTIAFGANASGDPEAVGFDERAGVVLDQTGQHPLPLAAGKAMVIGSGIGEGSAMSSGGFLLGQPGKGCLTEPDQDGDSRSVVGSGTDQVSFVTAPGALKLAWYLGLDCARPNSATVDTTVAAGRMVLAFAWYRAPRDLRLLVVPVSATGRGDAGTTDSGAAPANAPTDPDAATSPNVGDTGADPNTGDTGADPTAGDSSADPTAGNAATDPADGDVAPDDSLTP